MDGESGREIRISRTLDLVVCGDEETRISERWGEPAIVITGVCPELTLIRAKILQ